MLTDALEIFVHTLAIITMGGDDAVEKSVDKPSNHRDLKRKQAVGGVIVAVAAAAWFAFGKHYLAQRRFKNMDTFILKADNGVEAHIRPLGCCIQSKHVDVDCCSAATPGNRAGARLDLLVPICRAASTGLSRQCPRCGPWL